MPRGVRIYRINPPVGDQPETVDDVGELFDAAEAKRRVGGGGWTRTRPPGASPSRRGGSAERKPPVKPAREA